MPKVPTYTASDSWVSPNEAQLRAPDVSSGLEDIAQGGQRLGATADQYADMKASIIHMSSDTQARAQALQDSQAISKITTDFGALQGQNAVDAQPGVLKQITDIQQAGLKTMGTPLMQKLYTQHSAPTFAGANDQVYSHSVTQTVAAHSQQLGAETDQAQGSAASLATDPAKFSVGLDGVAAAADREAAFAGQTGDARTLYIENKKGQTVQSAIMQAKADKNYHLANALDLKFTASLPLALRNSVISEMAPVLEERRNSAVYKAAQVDGMTPTTDENRNWVIPTASGASLPDGSPATAQPGAAPPAGFQMPVPGKVGQTFAQHEARGSEGIDIPVPMGTAVKAPAAGVVRVGHDDRSGNFVAIDHPDGSTSVLAHFGTVQVKNGDQVNANTVLGSAGMTGDATGPHVHWQVTGKDDKPVDPLTLVNGKVGATAALTAPGGTIVPDEATIISRIQNMDLPQAQKDSAIAYAHGQMKDAQSAQQYSYAQAKEKAVEWSANYALAHGGNYPSDIPAPIAALMRPDEVAQMRVGFMEDAKAKSDKEKSDQQGTNYANLQVERYDNPGAFLAHDPASLIGKVTASQWNEIRVSQAQMRAEQSKPQPFDPYDGSSKALATYSKFNPGILPKPSDSSYSTQRAALLDGIRARATDFVTTKHSKPSAADWNAFAQDAAHQTVTTSGMLWGSTTKPAYQATAADVPADKRALIVQSYAKAHPGRTPTDQEITDRYRLLQQ